MALRIHRSPRGYRFKYKHGPKTARPKKRALASARAPTVEARTVFTWPRMGLPCGIAEFVKHLAAVSDGAAWCKHPSEIRNAEHVVMVIMPDLTQYDVEVVRRLRRLGARVTLSVHHFTVGKNPFQKLAREVNDVVWHHPRIPALAGFGRYVPLPVPTLPREAVGRLGGLTHFGLGTPYKRIDVMASVARDVGATLHCYGANNARFVPAHLAGHVVVDDSYPSDLELARRLRRHDCGMIGRLPWGATLEINGSASPRFFIGAGVPVVIDATVPHEDLVDVVDVVPYNDAAAVRNAVRLLLTSDDHRERALERADAYARATSPRRIAELMGIAVRA